MSSNVLFTKPAIADNNDWTRPANKHKYIYVYVYKQIKKQKNATDIERNAVRKNVVWDIFCEAKKVLERASRKSSQGDNMSIVCDPSGNQLFDQLSNKLIQDKVSSPQLTLCRGKGGRVNFGIVEGPSKISNPWIPLDDIHD